MNKKKLFIFLGLNLALITTLTPSFNSLPKKQSISTIEQSQTQIDNKVTAPQSDPAFLEDTGEPLGFAPTTATFLYEIDAGNTFFDNPYTLETITVKDSNTEFLYTTVEEFYYDETDNIYAGLIVVEDLIPDSVYNVDITATLETFGEIEYTTSQATMITGTEDLVAPTFTYASLRTRGEILSIDYTLDLGEDASSNPFDIQGIGLVEASLQDTIASDNPTDFIVDNTNNTISGTVVYEMPTEDYEYQNLYLSAGGESDINTSTTDLLYLVTYQLNDLIAFTDINYATWIYLGIGLGTLLLLIVVTLVGYWFIKTRE